MYLFNVGIIFSRSFKEGNVEGIRVFFSRCVIHHFFRSLKISKSKKNSKNGQKGIFEVEKTVFTDIKTFKNPIQNTNTNQISKRLPGRISTISTQASTAAAQKTFQNQTQTDQIEKS